MRPRLLALLTTLLMVTTACGGGGGGSGSATTSPDSAAGPGASPTTSPLAAAVASFDLATGEDQRLTVGLFRQSEREKRPVVGGEVQLAVAYLGEAGASPRPDPEPVGEATATFLPVPGQAPTEPLDQPAPSDGSAVGVYEASVDLPDAGLYAVTATADVADAGQMSATATFQVSEEHRVPVVGDEAPAVQNPTVGDSEVPPAAIDSRAGNQDGEIPDPELHDMTVARALESGRPTVIVVSTPVYCVSRFCGPITETVAELQSRFGERANFIHLEVWRSFDDQELNPAAAEYISTPQGGNEPWTFLVGADGTIQARWDNVLDRAELVEMLEAL